MTGNWLLGLILLLALWGRAVPLGPTSAIAAPQSSVTSPTLANLTPTITLDKLAQADVVYLGETHDSAADHQAQLEIIQALHRARPNLAIGLEMFQRPYQMVLDRYLAGTITEAQLLEQSQYQRRWGFPWEFYAPILRFAKAQKLSVIALNAPSEVSRKVARQGLASLTLSDRRFIPPPSALQLEPAAYRQMIRQVFEEMHQGKGNSDRFEKFFLTQVLWDETMAERVSQFLQAHPTTTMVVLAGQGHIVHGYGIPDRVARRMQNRQQFKQALVLLNPTPDLMNSPQQPPAADYFWHYPSVPGTK
jgi:uncharacterized iron-regulated protein